MPAMEAALADSATVEQIPQLSGFAVDIRG